MKFTEGELPNGWTQKDLKGIGAKIPMPETWFFNQTKEEKTLAFFLTKENLEKRGYFKTGLTMEAILQFLKRDRLSIIEFLQLSAKQDFSIKGVRFIGEPELKEDENFISMRRLASEEESYKPISLFDSPETLSIQRKEPSNQIVQFIASKRSGTLYALTFESPTQTWGINGEIGQNMLDNLMLNPKV